MVVHSPSINDILGIEQTKLGFFQEWQRKLKELQAAHDESERQRQVNAAILDSITDVMMVLDDNLRILSANKAVEELFPGRKLTGRFCHSLFCETEQACSNCPAFRSLREGSINRGTAIFLVEGRSMHFDMVASPMPHPNGQGKSVLMLKRDVTMHQQLQAQVYQTEKMASLGMLAAGVAHELNNPLTAISGFAEGIRRRVPRFKGQLPDQIGEDIAEYTATILRESDRCRDIVQALINFSRPLPSFQPLALNELIESTLSLLRHTIKQYRRVVVCLDLAENLPFVWGDDAQLRQVLLNLITNALDALAESGSGPDARGAPHDGVITIRTITRPQEVLLEVEDSGIGINPKHLATIFDPFFTTKPKGLGLGLSVCYSVIQAHQGEISITSSPGNTLATLSLPREPRQRRDPVEKY